MFTYRNYTYDKDSRGRCQNVVYRGKWPTVGNGWSPKLGLFWEIIFPGTFRVKVPRPRINLRGLKYSAKAFLSILSGFAGLEAQRCGGWEQISIGDGEDPYYVCAAFRNGRHIPLPIILGGSDSDLQNVAIKVAAFLKPSSFQTAYAACLKYTEEKEAKTNRSEWFEYKDERERHDRQRGNRDNTQ